MNRNQRPHVTIPLAIIQQHDEQTGRSQGNKNNNEIPKYRGHLQVMGKCEFHFPEGTTNKTLIQTPAPVLVDGMQQGMQHFFCVLCFCVLCFCVLCFCIPCFWFLRIVFLRFVSGVFCF
jgi:hypothetical protein